MSDLQNCFLRVPQRRLGVWAYSLIVVASVIFWFSSLADCSRAAFQYQGLPVTEVGATRGLLLGSVRSSGQAHRQHHSV